MQNFDFEVTDSAVSRIIELAAKQSVVPILRVSVEGGGCSGFSYKYEFAESAFPDDFQITKNNVVILVDSLSQEFLSGSALDFIRTLGASHFLIKNPNATAKCGCGNSFAI